MNKENCEEILMRLMAVFDGEETDFSPERLNAHLSVCAECRGDIDRLRNTFAALENQSRRSENVDLWSKIEPRLEKKMSWQPLAFLGVFLVGCKLAEMLPETDPGFVFKFAPLVLVVVLFAILKENPFKINTETGLEK